jgi:hypothetical protein
LLSQRHFPWRFFSQSPTRVVAKLSFTSLHTFPKTVHEAGHFKHALGDTASQDGRSVSASALEDLAYGIEQPC